MPDFNQYKADTPYIRPELPRIGLSSVLNPVLDYPTIHSPGTSLSFGAKDPNILPGEKNPFLGINIRPDPVVSSYAVAKRYDKPRLGYDPFADNENMYAQNQSNFESIAKGVGRLVLTAGTKLGTGIGYLGGLLGFGNNAKEYGGGFDAWIAGAGDNAIAKWFDHAEETVKMDWLPIYQEASDRNKGFFSRAVSDLNFWTEDFVDGAAFFAGAFVPGMVVSKLGLGTKVVNGLAKLNGLTRTVEEGALAAESLTGAVESDVALARGATTVKPTIQPKTIVATNDGFQMIPKVLSWIDNAKLARSVDVAATTMINTPSEAMFEAVQVKNDLYDKLASLKDVQGRNVYTIEQAKQMSAQGGSRTFKMNLAALALSNLWEANLMFKKLPTKGAGYAKGITTKGLWDSAVLQKKVFGQKLWNAVEKPLQGVVVEGFWEENIQLAIQRLNSQPENFDLDFADTMKSLGTQYLTQTVGALSGTDPEAALNIGLGGLIGSVFGKVTSANKFNQERKSIANLNAQVSMFKTLGNIYQVDDKGKLVFDEKNNPIVDEDKLKSYAASVNKILGLQEAARNLEGRGAEGLAKLYEDEIFARYVKAHLDNGMSEVLYQRLNDVQNLHKEDLALLGFDPNSKGTASAALAAKYKEKAIKLEEVYDNIQRNFLPNKDRKKFFEMTDKMFYMSARAGSILEQLKEAKDKHNNVMLNADSYNESFNKASDAAVNEYNQLFEKAQAAKRNIENGIYESDGEYQERRKEKDDADKELTDYVEANKETLNKMKKDARGRFMFEVANKNSLPAAKEMERLQIIQAELELGHESTVQILSRLADLNSGEKYYDTRFKPALENEIRKHAVPVDVPGSSVPPADQPQVAAPVVAKELTKFSKPEEVLDKLNELNKVKEALESKEDRSDEESEQLDEIYDEIEALEETKDAQTDEIVVNMVVEESTNIKTGDKEKYKEVLNKINEEKRKAKKTDDGYEINGETYRKVSDVINNTIPDLVRAQIKDSIDAGNTIDEIVKAYFGKGITQEFRKSIANKISADALSKIEKKLGTIMADLSKKGIEIVATNVIVYDPVTKVAGEIDLLGVDKNGDFKVYEIEARRGRTWHSILKRAGVGLKIADLTQNQLSAYRNLFANQYGVLPNEVGVLFPVAVEMETLPEGTFITAAKIIDKINVVPKALLKINSFINKTVSRGAFKGYNIFGLYANTFIPAANDKARARVGFLIRNITSSELFGKLTMKVRNAEQSFQDDFEKQAKLLNGELVSGYSITRHPEAPNLYALKGNKELALYYEGDELVGYMPPVPGLAYKDDTGKFKLLDENTPAEVYAAVTGNDIKSYQDFVNTTVAYKAAYESIVDRLSQTDGEAIITNDEIKELFNFSINYGSLDLIKTTERPLLKDLSLRGVKVGSTQIVTVVNLDENDTPQVIMDKTNKSKGAYRKYIQVDKWANDNLDQIKKAIETTSGNKRSHYAAIIELSDGTFMPISLKLAAGASVNPNADYVADLGSKFTAGVSERIFKNPNVQLGAKGVNVTTDLSLNTAMFSTIFAGEDAQALSKLGLDPDTTNSETNEQKVSTFLVQVDEDTLVLLQGKKLATVDEILDAYQTTEGFSDIDSFLENLKNC